MFNVLKAKTEKKVRKKNWLTPEKGHLSFEIKTFFKKKYINVWVPWIFLKMKTLTRVPKFWIWTSKIIPDLCLLDLFCPTKKISTLHTTV